MMQKVDVASTSKFQFFYAFVFFYASDLLLMINFVIRDRSFFTRVGGGGGGLVGFGRGGACEKNGFRGGPSQKN